MGDTRRLLTLSAAVLISVAVADSADDSYMNIRTKRDLMGLGQMVGTVTGKGLFSVMTTYNGYGCYCGIGGKGTPVDGVDRCCMNHDRCFSVAQQGVCSTSKNTIYSQSYKYKSKNTKNNKEGSHAEIQCAPASHYKKEGAAQGLCSESICECDRALATCLAEHKYNNKFVHYDRSKCK